MTWAAVSGFVSVAVVLAACEVQQRPARTAQTDEDIDRENAARMAAAERRDEEATRKRDAAEDEKRQVKERDFNERAERYKAERAAATKPELEPEPVPKSEPEPDEGYLAYEWASKNCKFSQDASHYVQHCDPVCWVEEVVQCPKFTCSAKPPTKGWVELANRRACTAASGTTNRRARGVGENGFPPPQGPRR